MTTTAFGPQGPNYTITRPPADPEASAGTDTWFKNCSAAGAKDGTFATAAFFNVMVANLRYLVRTAGISLDDTDDTMVYNAVRAALSGGGGGGTITNGIPYIGDTSPLANSIIAPFNPAFVAAVSEGTLLEIKIANTNTGATALQVNGLAPLPVMRQDGSQLKAGDIVGSETIIVENHGTYYQLMSVPWSILNSPVKTTVANSNDTVPPGNVATYCNNMSIATDTLGTTLVGSSGLSVPIAGTYLCIAQERYDVQSGVFVGIERFSSAGADLGNVAVWGMNAYANNAQSNAIATGLVTLNAGDVIKAYCSHNSNPGSGAPAVSQALSVQLSILKVA